MAENSKIEWTDATWNPITGCTMVSAGCTNCYAMGLAATRLRHHPSREGLTRMTGGRPVWTGEVRLNEQWLDQPLRWKRGRMIFVCAHGDLFHESVPDEWIDRVFAVMALATQHTFQVLTKRPERAREYLTTPGRVGDVLDACLGYLDTPGHTKPRMVEDGIQLLTLPNVWLGTSIEDQATADARTPHLLATPAAVRFVSAEPLLGPVDLSEVAIPRPDLRASVIWDALRGWGGAPSSLDWVIVGGESGPGARPMHPDWARSLRDQCQAAGVAFHFKQWGEWETSLDRELDDPDWREDYSNNYVDRGKSRWLNLAGGRGFHGERFHVMRRVGKKAAGRLLDGRTWDQFPGAAE
jgi:protein gp37